MPTVPRCIPFACAFAAGLLALGAGLAGLADAATDAERCLSSKQKAAGKEGFLFLNCAAKAARKNEAVDPACITKAEEKFDKSWDKAEAKGGCSTNGERGRVEAIIRAQTDAATAALTHGVDQDSQKCAFSKRKATGRYLFSVLKCYAKAATRGEAVDTKCLTKAEVKLDGAFFKAESKAGCATPGDLGALQTLMDDAFSEIGGVLNPTCGDDVTAAGEQCDGADDGVCPGQCSSLCTCCGDGGLFGVEECDDGNALGGDGCSSSCQLEDVSALCAGVTGAAGTAIDAALVASGLVNPTQVTAPRLDTRRVFVLEQPGRIRLIKDGVLQAPPFLAIESAVGDSGNEQGLLGLAFHPDYESNGRFFINYTNNSGNTVIARYQADGGDANSDVADVSSGIELITIGQDFSNHNGGQVAFGPDGMLYIGMGDGGSGCDPNGRSQDDNQLLGKMLRMDVDVETPPYYTVPTDNPNPGAGMPLGLVWSKGLRNPFRFSFDRGSGDLYISDVGQNEIEEVSVESAGSPGGLNFGWRNYEGNTCVGEGDSCPSVPPGGCPDPTGFTFPVLQYTQAQGCSVIGGFVYRGCEIPDLDGTYFYSDFCSGWIRTFELIGGLVQNQSDVTTDLQDQGAVLNNPTSFGEDARGEIYIVDRDGEIFKIQPQ